MKKSKIIILALLAIGLGSVLYVPESKGFIKRAFKKVKKTVKDTAKKVGKEVTKVAEEVFDAAKDVGEKIKGAGEDAIDAVERLGEDVWKKISGIEDCLNVVKYGTAWSSAQASYQAAKRSMEVSSVGLRIAGDVAGKLKDIPAEMLRRGVNITKFEFSASVADTLQMTLPRFRVEGTAFGKKFGIHVALDASDMERLVTELFEAIIKEVF